MTEQLEEWRQYSRKYDEVAVSVLRSVIVVCDGNITGSRSVNREERERIKSWTGLTSKGKQSSTSRKANNARGSSTAPAQLLEMSPLPSPSTNTSDEGEEGEGDEESNAFDTLSSLDGEDDFPMPGTSNGDKTRKMVPAKKPAPLSEKEKVNRHHNNKASTENGKRGRHVSTAGLPTGSVSKVKAPRRPSSAGRERPSLQMAAPTAEGGVSNKPNKPSRMRPASAGRLRSHANTGSSGINNISNNENPPLIPLKRERAHRVDMSLTTKGSSNNKIQQHPSFCQCNACHPPHCSCKLCENPRHRRIIIDSAAAPIIKTASLANKFGDGAVFHDDRYSNNDGHDDLHYDGLDRIDAMPESSPTVISPHDNSVDVNAPTRALDSVDSRRRYNNKNNNVLDVYSSWCKKLSCPLNASVVAQLAGHSPSSSSPPSTRWSFPSCHIGDRGVVPLIAAITSNDVGLTYLNLADNGLTDIGLITVSSSLAFQNHLSEFDVSENNLSEIGITSLIKLAENLPSLRTIHCNLNKQKVRAEVKQQLSESIQKKLVKSRATFSSQFPGRHTTTS